MRRWSVFGVVAAGWLPLGCPTAECALADCESSQIRVTIIDPNGQPFLPDNLYVRIDDGTQRGFACDDILVVCTFYLGGQFESELSISGVHTYTFEASSVMQTGASLSGEAVLEIDHDAVPNTECCGRQVVREITVQMQRE